MLVVSDIDGKLLVGQVSLSQTYLVQWFVRSLIKEGWSDQAMVYTSCLCVHVCVTYLCSVYEGGCITTCNVVFISVDVFLPCPESLLVNFKEFKEVRLVKT